MSKLDKSLDEIIRTNKPVRNARTKNFNRSTPYYRKAQSVDGRRVYVGNLTWATDWRALKDYMRAAGDVSYANIFEYPDGKSKGCGLVEFETAAGAKNAIETLHDTVLDGRPIFVREDREARGNFNYGGGGGGRRFSDNNFDQPMFSPISNLAQKIRNKAPPNSTVYIGNLPYSAEWQELKDICSKFGEVSRADVEQDENGRSKGYGIAVFENARGAAKCIRELNGASYGDRELSVRLDKFKSYGQSNFSKGSFGSSFGSRFGSGKRVYIGNLPWSVEWQDLKDLCKQYGNVIRADVEKGDDGRSRGFGLVTFANQVDSNNCIANLNGMLLDGRELNVRYENR